MAPHALYEKKGAAHVFLSAKFSSRFEEYQARGMRAPNARGFR
jgi:hypothetical protein